MFGLGFTQSVGGAEKHAARKSFRDAIARAEGAAKPEDALRMLARAEMIGDSLLAKAVALIAYERQWFGVLGEYAKTSPSIEDSLQELEDFEVGLGGRRRQFSDKVAFTQIPEPNEERSVLYPARPHRVTGIRD